MEEELPRLSAFTLAQQPRCGERARRLLDGLHGNAKMGGTRWRLGQRLREDVALAHSEWRRPSARDFPTPAEFSPEERAVYAAAAVGYLTLFGDDPARTVDVAGHTQLGDLGVEVSARPGVFLDTERGVELRMLTVNGTEPHVIERNLHAAAVLAPPHLLPVRVVAADLLALQTTTAQITDDHVAPAREWFGQRIDVWRESASAGAFDQKDCYYCTFIWDCRVHARSRTP